MSTAPPTVSGAVAAPAPVVIHPARRRHGVSFVLLAVMLGLAINGPPPWVVRTVGDVSWAFALGAVVVFLRIAVSQWSRRYTLDRYGVHARVGLIACRRPSLRWRDVSKVASHQTLWGRVTPMGTVELSSAGTSDVDLRLLGIANPRKVCVTIDRLRTAAGAST